MLEPFILAKLFFDIIDGGPAAIGKAAATSVVPGSDWLDVYEVAHGVATIGNASATRRNWDYCGLSDCHCSLPKVCTRDHCDCSRIKACTRRDRDCGCSRMRVCTDLSCSCSRPKVRMTGSAVGPDPSWNLCAKKGGCPCSLPKVCTDGDCDCSRPKVCTRGDSCDCGRRKACTDRFCHCSRPKVLA